MLNDVKIKNHGSDEFKLTTVGFKHSQDNFGNVVETETYAEKVSASG